MGVLDDIANALAVSGPKFAPHPAEALAMSLRGLGRAAKAQPTAGQPPTKAESPGASQPFDPTYGGRVPANTAPPKAAPAPQPARQPQPAKQPSQYRASPYRDATWPANPYAGKDPNMYNLWEQQMEAKRHRPQKASALPPGSTIGARQANLASAGQGLAGQFGQGAG